VARRDRAAAVASGALVVLAGLNLRDPITSVSAVLTPIADAYRLTPFAVSALSSLPVLMLAAGAPLAPVLERRLGVRRAVVALSALLVLALLVRPLAVPTLFAGTVLAGIAIAGLSVLIPQLVRDDLGSHAGLWSGLFSTSFGLSAALGAALVVPLLGSTGSLSVSLAVWAAPAAVLTAAALVAAATHRPAARTADAGPAAPTGRTDRPRAGRFRVTAEVLQLTAFFGCQALVFFAVTAWLPTLFVDRGLGQGTAAALLAVLSIAGLPASMLVSLLAARVRRQHLLVAGVSALSALGLAGVTWAPLPVAPLAAGVLGFAQGAAFGLAVALIVLRAPRGIRLASFSAFVQGCGYAIAALGPLLLGTLRAAAMPWAIAVCVLLSAVTVQGVTGWLAARPRRDVVDAPAVDVVPAQS
jgi:MFS transporter, CP family, cyanate transporter